MQLNGVRYCESCSIAIGAQEPGRVEFEHQDFHFACWKKILDAKFTLLQQTSFLESERPLSPSRLMGG